jgi:deoxyribodipyrimidine photo-lyase
MKINVFWLRRDLRLTDNVGLSEAMKSDLPVLPVFIFDKQIIDELPEEDARLGFIHETLSSMNEKLKEKGSGIRGLYGKPEECLEQLTKEFEVNAVYTNRDYEPYALDRDYKIDSFLKKKGIEFKTFKDQVIFEKSEVTKDDGKPYTVYTPFKNKWLSLFDEATMIQDYKLNFDNFLKGDFDFPSLNEMGFKESTIKVRPIDLSQLDDYEETRNFPATDGTTYLGPHLRFGTVSVRSIIRKLEKKDEIFLSELIWREFFMQVLFHFPHVVSNNFRAKYDGIKWRNDKDEFEKWCKGKTGYPMVDAGMRQLNKTGYMHNRVRMVTASFLCKHLLIDWKWGEAYFAQKLLDYELASNNGNWQWAAGTGCDASPYFRVFNPESQLIKFDKGMKYIGTWAPEYLELIYPKPMVEHKFARERAIATYKEGIDNN